MKMSKETCELILSVINEEFHIVDDLQRIDDVVQYVHCSETQDRLFEAVEIRFNSMTEYNTF